MSLPLDPSLTSIRKLASQLPRVPIPEHRHSLSYVSTTIIYITVSVSKNCTYIFWHGETRWNKLQLSGPLIGHGDWRSHPFNGIFIEGRGLWSTVKLLIWYCYASSTQGIQRWLKALHLSHRDCRRFLGDELLIHMTTVLRKRVCSVIHSSLFGWSSWTVEGTFEKSFFCDLIL